MQRSPLKGIRNKKNLTFWIRRVNLYSKHLHFLVSVLLCCLALSIVWKYCLLFCINIFLATVLLLYCMQHFRYFSKHNFVSSKRSSRAYSSITLAMLLQLWSDTWPCFLMPNTGESWVGVESISHASTLCPQGSLVPWEVTTHLHPSSPNSPGATWEATIQKWQSTKRMPATCKNMPCSVSSSFPTRFLPFAFFLFNPPQFVSFWKTCRTGLQLRSNWHTIQCSY